MQRKEIERRCRGQRISHAELVAEAQQKLKESGAGNHQRAMFISELAEAVVGNNCPVLCQLQPKIKIRTDIAWLRAYDLAFKFIDEHGLGLTMKTLTIECGDTKQKLESAVADIAAATEQLEELVMLSQTDKGESESETFQTKVNKFTEMTSDAYESESSFIEPSLPEPKQKPKLAIIPPSRPIDDTTKSPPRVSAIGKEIVIDTPETLQKKETVGKRGIGNKLAPMKPQTEKPKDTSSYPKPLSPRAQQNDAFSRADNKKNSRRIQRKELESESELTSQPLSEFEMSENALQEIDELLLSSD